MRLGITKLRILSKLTCKSINNWQSSTVTAQLVVSAEATEMADSSTIPETSLLRPPSSAAIGCCRLFRLLDIFLCNFFTAIAFQHTASYVYHSVMKVAVQNGEGLFVRVFTFILKDSERTNMVQTFFDKNVVAKKNSGRSYSNGESLFRHSQHVFVSATTEKQMSQLNFLSKAW
jgi:hypothetical protein